VTDDYEIKILDSTVANEDVPSPVFVSLSSDNYCGVRFDAVGSPDLRESVFDIAGGDGSQFGVEYYGSINWTITGAVHSGTASTPGLPSDAWDSWAALYRAWVDYPGRTTPRAVRPLGVKRPGREEMIVYGRPRRIDPDTSTSYVGHIAYTAQFKQSDPKFYSSTSSSINLQIIAATPGGLILNVDQDALVVPLTTSAGTPRTGVVTNSGDANTSPVITIAGPVTNPLVVLMQNGSPLWTVRLLTSIAAGVQVIVDTRLWQRTITTADGANFAGYYRGDKLQDVVIPPGTSEFQYTGIDGTGTSTCSIEYRNAWVST